ncbi:MAG TPA: OmpH family outer membrane protein [Verrucomicrobiae bacterium]|nr:OmpH family outer membrane protein [Verrucomicrobiae bacterium]
MNKKIAVWTVIAVCACGLSAGAQGAGRIVTIDLNKVFNGYYKTPIATAKLKETVDSYKKEHDDMVANYKQEIDELNKLREEQDKTEYTPEVREQKRKAVAEKIQETQKLNRDIEEYDRTHQDILKEQTQRMRQTIVKEITDVIDKEARDQGYLFVLDTSGNTLNGVPAVVYAQSNTDITDDILKILNKNQPTTSETTPPSEKKTDKKSNKK